VIEVPVRPRHSDGRPPGRRKEKTVFPGGYSTESLPHRLHYSWQDISGLPPDQVVRDPLVSQWGGFSIDLDYRHGRLAANTPTFAGLGNSAKGWTTALLNQRRSIGYLALSFFRHRWQRPVDPHLVASNHQSLFSC
jgi:hypothetical protein